MLLLFSVRLVRTGIERAHGASFQRLLRNQTNLIGAGISGVSLAIVMQSSAAVALLAAGFLGSNYLIFPTALAIVLGGDLGSAFIVQILSFPVKWIIAPLLAIGGWFAVKSENPKLRQYGRIIMGIALILISLGLLRETVEPVRESAFLPAIAAYLERDLITAFIVGGVLAFIMHSGVAAILVIVTLVQIDALPFSAGIAIMLGANLGSGFIPVWLTRGMGINARRLVFANLTLRGLFAVIVLFAIILTPVMTILPTSNLGPGQILIFSHVGFNFCLLIIALPFCRWIDFATKAILPEGPHRIDKSSKVEPNSHLDRGTLNIPKLAITSLKQELLKMSAVVETMFRPSLEIYLENNEEMRRSIHDMDSEVNRCLSDIRSFVASIPTSTYDKSEARSARDMVEYAIRLESAGDVISKRMTDLSKRLHSKADKFSNEGRVELVQLHENILANFKLAANVLISDDPESARLLSLKKTEIKHDERTSRKRHLMRLQKGNAESFETSDIHLETLRALREVNSHISAVAYPILYKTGQLLETRLIQDLPVQDAISKD